MVPSDAVARVLAEPDAYRIAVVRAQAVIDAAHQVTHAFGRAYREAQALDALDEAVGAYDDGPLPDILAASDLAAHNAAIRQAAALVRARGDETGAAAAVEGLLREGSRGV